MKVATNMFGAEDANLIIDANELGLKLNGVVCPFIELGALEDLLRNVTSKTIKVITSKGSIGKWYKYYGMGKIPAKGGTPARRELSLDWIQNLTSKGSDKHELTSLTNGKQIVLKIHAYPEDKLHTKLYVYDKGFVVTSGNITDKGLLFRHLELGILVTEDDNKLEVEIVKQWFENRWNGRERSCLAIRIGKTMDFAKKIIEKVLEKEIKENRKKHGKPEFYFSNRLFCFGCDEGRNGKKITRKVQIENKNYEEIVCEGCDQILNKIRIFMPTLAQEMSHKERVVWRISKKYYDDKYTHLYHYKKFDEDDDTISFDITDNGSIDKLIQALVASKIEGACICLNCGDVIQSNFQICPYCGISVKTHLFGI